MPTAMTTKKSFAIFDADSHVVEPRGLWEQYLEPGYRVLGKHALWREEGETNSYLKINGKIWRDSGNPRIPRHAIWRPGMTWESVGELDPEVRHSQAGAKIVNFSLATSETGKTRIPARGVRRPNGTGW